MNKWKTSAYIDVSFWLCLIVVKVVSPFIFLRWWYWFILHS